MRSLALAALAATAVALAPPGAPRTLKTRRQAAVAEPDAKAKVSSANAKRQVGNDAFLNKDLRARARGGTGVVNDAKLKIGIVGAGLAGMVCAMDLADAGHEVEIFELRPFVGGKVSSWKDKEGNHIEMGLHVFFGCYYNLFGIMERTGSYDLLRMKEHIHTFVNKGGELGALDFRFPVGAPVSGLQAFARTEQLGWGDKAANALRLGTSPIVRALVDFDGGMDMVRDLDDVTFTEWFTSFGRRRGVFIEPYAIDARRLHQTRSWVVVSLIFGCFGLRGGHRRGVAETVASRATPSTRSRRWRLRETTPPWRCRHDRTRGRARRSIPRRRLARLHRPHVGPHRLRAGLY